MTESITLTDMLANLRQLMADVEKMPAPFGFAQVRDLASEYALMRDFRAAGMSERELFGIKFKLAPEGLLPPDVAAVLIRRVRPGETAKPGDIVILKNIASAAP